MYRVVLADGELKCDRYEMGPHGIDLFDEDGEMVAFVPYETLIAVINDETYEHDDPALM